MSRIDEQTAKAVPCEVCGYWLIQSAGGSWIHENPDLIRDEDCHVAKPLESIADRKQERIRLQADKIVAEVSRAMNLHAPMNSLHEAYAVILEEIDEFWDLVKTNPKKLSVEIQTIRIRDMHEELIQIAAMCIRATIDCNLDKVAK